MAQKGLCFCSSNIQGKDLTLQASQMLFSVVKDAHKAKRKSAILVSLVALDTHRGGSLYIASNLGPPSQVKRAE